MRLSALIPLVAVMSLQAEDPFLVNAETRWTAERWDLPRAGEGMGMVGLQVHRTWACGGYAGFGGWGSVRGEQGGFIATGVSGGWRFPLTERLALDAGAWVGGGGVGRAGIGSGLMLRGHAGLSWDFDWARLGLEASRVRFPNGEIDSSQVAVTAVFPFRAIVGSPAAGGGSLPEFGQRLGTELGWRDFSLAMTGQRYTPAHSVHALDSASRNDPVDLVGLEARLGLGQRAFAVWDMSGAAGGEAAGYMDMLLGLGYALPLDRAGRWDLVGKLCGGPAGGGHLDVGGGMAWKATLGVQATTRSGFQVGLNAGYFVTPGGSFKASVCQVQAGRRFELATPGTASEEALGPLDFTGWSVRTGMQRLKAPQRRGGADPDPIELVGFQMTHDLSEAWYLAGQGNFALTGHAGGFAEGLLGLGWRSPDLSGAGTRALVQAMAGAAGGGGVDTSGGFLLQPMVGVEQELGRGVSLQVMAGRCIAPGGDLSTPVLDAGLAWRFGLPTRTGAGR